MPVEIKKTRARVSQEDRQRYKLEADLRTAKAQLGDAKKQIKYYERENQQLDAAINAHLAIARKTRPLQIRANKRSKGSETCAIVQLSDWHVEETVVAETVQHQNEFNLSIADQRIGKLFDKILHLVQLWRAGSRIDHLVLALEGDFITGYIHEELEESNGLSPIEAVLWVKRRIRAGIDYLLENGGFKKISVPCVIGNHGRTTKKSRISTARKNSYEWGMYCDLADHYQDDPRIQFHIPDSYFCNIDLFGRLVRFHHGDYLKYNGGVGGITIPVNKAIAQWNRTEPAWLDLFGHYHQYLDHGNWCCNLSLIGYNAYALSIKAPFEPAGQNLIFVEKEKGKVGTLPIYL